MIGFVIGILEVTAGMSLVILLLLAVMKLFGGKFTAKCRYLLWTLALLRLAIPFSAGILPALFEIPMPEENPAVEITAAGEKAAEAPMISETAPTAGFPQPAGIQPKPSGNSGTPAVPEVPYSAEDPVLAVPKDNIGNDTPAESAEQPEPAFTTERLIPAAAHLYLTGAAVFFLWNLLAYGIYTGRILRRADPADERTQKIFEAVCRKAGLRRTPVLRVSGEVQSPIAFGLIRQKIVLPALELSDNGLTGTLSHEVTHCRRGDLLVKFLALIARSLHWFNPLAHLAARKCETEMELSCDEAVLDGCSEEARIVYGQVMLDIIRRCRRNHGALTTHFNPRKSAVKLRLNNILDGSGKKKGRVLIALCVLCCLLAGAVVSCRFTESDEPDEPVAEDVQEEVDAETPPENADEAELPDETPSETPDEQPEPVLWQKELSIYRCDDVYRTDDTPTRGKAVVTIPALPSEYEVQGCDVLLCDDGCDPTDVLSRAFWGYAPVFRIEKYVEFGESDGWAYPARRYDFTPPDDVAEGMRESGVPEYHIYSRKYLYLLTLDGSRYAYFEIQAVDEEEPKPDGEEKTVDAIVRSAVIEVDSAGDPFPAAEYTVDMDVDEEAGEYIEWAGAYGNAIGGSYDGVLHAGQDGEWFAVLGIASHRRDPGNFSGFRTYQVFCKDGMITDVRPTVTVTKEQVLSSGVPCESLPDGYWQSVYTDSESGLLYGCFAYTENGRITLSNGIYATDAGTVSEGTCTCDPGTGRFYAELYDLRENSAAEPRILTGSLYRYGRFVCYLADDPRSPLPILFLNDPAPVPEVSYPAEFTGDWYHSYTAPDGSVCFYEFMFDIENRKIRFYEGVYESEFGFKWSGSFTVHPMTYRLSAVLHDERNEQPDLTMDLEMSYSGSAEGRVVSVRFLDCNSERYASLIGQTLTFTDEPAVPAYVPVEYDLPAPENFEFYWEMFDAASQEPVGYTVNGEEGAAYYNCVTGRYITGFDYGSFEVCGRYLIARQSRYDDPEPLGLVRNVVLDSVTGQLLYDFGEEERASPGTNGVTFLTGGAGIFFRNENGWPYFDLYTEDFRPVGQFWFGDTDGNGNFVGSGVIPNGDDFDPGKSFFVYSPAGELIRESREYDGILCVNYGYVLVNDGGRIRLLDSSENLLADFGEWNDDLYMHWMISGYAASGKGKVPGWETEYYILNADGSYSPAEEPEVYPPCCWFTIEDRAIPYGTMGSGREYLYYPETGEAAVLWTIGVGGYAKPVLYLYPEDETDVTVTFARPDALTTTYPKYESAWEVQTSPDGTLTDARGRHYYALYWEERGYLPADFREGFCVAAADAASFLEEKLAVLGLTEREANEFILYWLPVMELNPYSLVYFELTESRQAWNGLTISPEPDSLLRIAMHVKGADEPVTMRVQRIPTWERTGFSAVEWGGVVER